MNLKFLLITLLILISYIILGSIVYFMFDSWQTRASFGDMFGCINGVFSALAFGGLIYSIWIQQKELENQNKTLNLQITELALQREELKLTREELEKTRVQHSKSADASNEQAFEMVKQSKLNFHAAKITALRSKIESLEGFLKTDQTMNLSLDHVKKRELKGELKKAYFKINQLASKPIEEILG